MGVQSQNSDIVPKQASPTLMNANVWSIPFWCAAYMLHLAEDIISGGIDFFSTGHVIGKFYFSPMYWPLIDPYLIAVVFLLGRKIKGDSTR